MGIYKVETVKLTISCSKCGRDIVSLSSCTGITDEIESLGRAFILCAPGECQELEKETVETIE